GDSDVRGAGVAAARVVGRAGAGSAGPRRGVCLASGRKVIAEQSRVQADLAGAIPRVALVERQAVDAEKHAARDQSV
ncbi:unnamed protein product, partial [Prorocentrum cordatum]